VPDLNVRVRHLVWSERVWEWSAEDRWRFYRAYSGLNSFWIN